MSLITEKNNINSEEHILVCLSAAPSNKKIIDTATKMAEGLQARFTALYVQTGTKAEAMDKERLEEHIRYAEKLGAEIVMTHGENIPVQIAEYARLSNVTKIVIGQNNARRNHFFSRMTLTEKLIELVPDIDIHIIPDAVKTKTYQKRPFAWYMEKPSARDYFLTAFIFAVCTLIGLLFQKLNFTDTNIVTIYILGVLLTSIVTDGYLCSVAGSFLSVFLFCFFLTEPRMSFQTYAVGYPVTFLITLISSVLTGALAAKLKTHAKLSAQLAFRTQILFDTDRLLQKAKGEREILDVTCTQLLRLLNRNITAYVVENNALSEGKLFSGAEEDTEDFLTKEEQQIARWTYENRQRAGASTHHFPQAKCLYLAIRSGNNVYGVIGIPLQKETLDSFEYSILLSVINECALAMENAQNAMEKEKNAVIAKNEQLRADLLRAISHDLRTPLCSISGNADMLLSNSERLDEATKHQIYTDIYDDSEWLIGVVENLLSITRLNDGRLKFKFSDQLLDEVIAESLRHISRKHDDYKIVSDCEELVLARMDVRLIIQVLVNLIDNAIKYTPPGTVICIQGTKTDGKAQISVKDNGPGIPDEMKPHIFQMFYTGKTTVADSHRSLGLGLALCHSIIEAHDGTLILTDHDPHGCNFTFTLPLSEVTLNE
ncbi:ATP-binding protein [Ruminococcus sp. AF31-8BH]|uniref:ATP-binding protein n=1 Tax=Ruminococcus sp. AF31-8BH TaxID=2293174 RepID=UPI000E51BFAD|nr:ATP-binding protein [Ruminococcus sp. AF31-8BH]RGF74125.1 sensor histidine kinase KdpD [Ruminococcus sp. AF31-8BH]